MDTHRNHPDAGFTLLEMITTLGVLAALTALAAPSLQQTWQRAATQHAFSRVSSSLALARVHAVTRGHSVTVCPSRDGSRCNGDSDWTDGWIVFLDADHDNQPQSHHDIVELVDGIPAGLTLTTTAGRRQIRYRASGRSAGSNLSLSVCTRAGHLAGKVVINNAGRPRVERTKNAEHPCPAF